MKKVKKFLSVVVVLGIVISTLCFSSIAAGSSNFTVVNGILTEYNGNGGDVVIPDNLGISAIGDLTFNSRTSITSITLPSGVTSIGKLAFFNCSNLAAISLPSSLTSIGLAAFNKCSSLKSITIPKNVTSVGAQAFVGTSISIPILINEEKTLCYVPTTYKSYEIPKTVTTINSGAFVNCSLITSITISENVTNIGPCTFTGTNIPTPILINNRSILCYVPSTYTSYTVPATVVEINGAFTDCSSLTSVIIPNGVTSIGNSSFFGCINLTAIDLPGSITKIDDLAFYKCASLTMLSIPISVISIGNDAFYACDKLTIYGLANSAAQTYAVNNNIPFVAITVTKTATPTASSVLVNGKSIAFEAYTINGNNYFKLRDVAKVLSGTGKQFEVGWDGVNNAISLTTGEPYTTVSGELTKSGATQSVTATQSSSRIYLNGVQINVTAYTIGGNNYFKLRDVGAAIDFGVTWDGKMNTIGIDTSTGYTA